MEYRSRINFADSFDLYDIPQEEGMPYIQNVKMKDSTSLDNNITLGTSVSKMLTFSIKNSPVDIFDGMKLVFAIKAEDVGEADVDLTDLGLTDEEVLNNLFEPTPDDMKNEIEFTPEQAELIQTGFEEDGETTVYEVPVEDEELSEEEEGTPDNEVYREDELSTETVGADGEVDDYVQMGEFYVTNIRVVDEVYYIEALDGFILMNRPYVPTNPTATVEEMYNDFILQLEQIGITCNEEPEYPSITIHWDISTTFREAAGYFAGLMGGYATFDRNGALDIRQYMKNADISLIEEDVSSLEVNTDGTIYINGMICDTDITALTNYIKTSDDADEEWTINFTNPFMTQEVLLDIYQTYYEYLQYTPARAVLDWQDGIRAGDLIQIGEDWILITNQTIDFARGTTTIDSLGTTATRSDGQIENPFTRVMQRTQRVLKSAVETAEEIATGASTIARAVSQHFWSTEEPIYFLTQDTAIVSGKIYYKQIDDVWTTVIPQTGEENPSEEGWYERTASGAFVTELTQEEFVTEPSGKNSIWNSAGMLFRDGLKNLLAIVTGNSTGVAIYDGQGNTPSNIVASFTNNGAVVGKTEEGHIEISDNDFIMKDSKGGDSFKVTQDEDSASSETYTENMEMMESGDAFMGGSPRELEGMTVEKALTNDYKSGISIGFVLNVYYGELKNHAIKYTLYDTQTVTLPSLGTFTCPLYEDGDSSSAFFWTYSGETSFDATNNVVTFSITDYQGDPESGWDVWWNWSYIKVELIPFFSYQTSLLMPVVTIGRYADTTTHSDTVFAIGKSKLTPGESTTNVFRVARDGSTNIQGGVNAYSYKVLGHNSPIGTVLDDWLGNTVTNRTLATSTWKAISTLSLPAGVWLVIGIFRFPASNAGVRRANIHSVNAHTANNWNSNHISASEVVNGQIVKVVQPTDWTDYYLNVWQNSGSSMTLPEGDAQSINSLRAIRLL